MIVLASLCEAFFGSKNGTCTETIEMNASFHLRTGSLFLGVRIGLSSLLFRRQMVDGFF